MCDKVLNEEYNLYVERCIGVIPLGREWDVG
jgi:hypothetical protein